MDHLIHHMLRSSTERAPGKEALVHGSDRLDYAELARRCAGLAGSLRALGLERGDRVGILLDPGVSQTVSILAVSEAGGVFVPINAALFPDQVAHIVADCDMRVLITTSRRGAALAPALHQPTTLTSLIVDDDAEELADHDLAAHRIDDLIPDGAVAPLPDLCIGRDLAALLYTSGSTGSPKGVMVSHAQVMAGASIVSTYLGITSEDRILAVLPFSFDAGLNQLMTAIQRGGTILPLGFTFAREIVAALEAEHITGLAGVPTLWALLTQPRAGLGKADLTDLRYVTNTGGHLGGPVLAELRRQLPSTDVVLMYGLTEAFRSTYLPPDEIDARPGSMGRAIPNTEILVVAPDGTQCRPGEIGELVHRGPTVSLGYWGRPDLTAERLRPHPFRSPTESGHELVCYSGDLVRMDEDGYLYFVGRADSMIKTSGYRVSPTEVEEVAMSSGLLQGAAAVGIPDDILGQSIVLFVLADDDAAVDGAAVTAHCAGHAPPYMVPKQVVVMDELPMTSTGKYDYNALRSVALERTP